MKLKKRSIVQLITTICVATVCIIYYLFINDYIDFRILSIGDMNPYGGWSALKSFVTDLSYRCRGLTRSMTLTITIIITALFFGRFFCGYICPIGALQDFFKFFGKKLKFKEIKISNKYHLYIIKYFILIIAIIFSIIGLGNLISPFSPWLAYLNIFMGFNFQFGTLILFLIIIASLFMKRIFCRFFCPLGAMQSLFSAVGFLKVCKSNKCGNCSYCLKNCPVEINNTDDVSISPECINCSECTSSSCLKGYNGFTYKFFNREIKNYFVACILLFMSIYVILPIIPSASRAIATGQLDNLNDGNYLGLGIGFGGNIEIEVSVEGNKIKNITLLNHNETVGYYEEVHKVFSKKVEETQNLYTDAISGATATCRGYMNAVKDAVSKSLSKKR